MGKSQRCEKKLFLIFIYNIKKNYYSFNSQRIFNYLNKNNNNYNKKKKKGKERKEKKHHNSLLNKFSFILLIITYEWCDKNLMINNNQFAIY